MVDQLKTFLTKSKLVPILVFMLKKENKVDLIDEGCDDLSIFVEQILKEDYSIRFREITAT